MKFQFFLHCIPVFCPPQPASAAVSLYSAKYHSTEETMQHYLSPESRVKNTLVTFVIGR